MQSSTKYSALYKLYFKGSLNCASKLGHVDGFNDRKTARKKNSLGSIAKYSIKKHKSMNNQYHGYLANKNFT